MSDLKPEDLNDIVELLAPLAAGEPARRALLNRAFVDHPEVLRKIEYSGPVQDFAVNLVQTLDG